MENNATYEYYADTTPNLKRREGFWTFKNVKRCILSFSASSSSVWIQPLSLFIVLNDLRCLCMAATNPGTPATVSKKSILFSQSFSVRTSFYQGKTFLYPLIISKLNLKDWMKALAKLSPKLAGLRWVISTYLTSYSVQTGWGIVHFSVLRISSFVLISWFFSSGVSLKFPKLYMGILEKASVLLPPTIVVLASLDKKLIEQACILVS